MKKFIPDEQVGAGFKKRDENGYFQTLLKMARENLYDESGRIKNADGTIIEDSNVAKLLALAYRPESFLPGIPAFVNLLRQIGIDHVPNENIGAMGGVRVQRQERPAPAQNPTPQAARVPPPDPPAPRLPPPDPLAHEVPLPPSDDECEQPRAQKRKKKEDEGNPPKKTKRGERRSSRLSGLKWKDF